MVLPLPLSVSERSPRGPSELLFDDLSLEPSTLALACTANVERRPKRALSDSSLLPFDTSRRVENAYWPSFSMTTNTLNLFDTFSTVI